MKLKVSMLMSILQNYDTPNKYSKSFLNLKNVINLEDSDIKPEYRKEFIEIEKTYNNLKNNIPVDVIEKYVSKNIYDLNLLCYILYKDNEISDYTILELHNLLEQFYAKIFFLASKIANYYNIEVKLNKDNSNIVDKI